MSEPNFADDRPNVPGVGGAVVSEEDGFLPRFINHPTWRGVLCWGGPEHGRVVPIEGGNGYYVFPVRTRITRVPEDEDPRVMARLATVRYDLEKFGWRNPNGDSEMWRVLVYPENKDTQKKQLEVAANFVIWLATPALLLQGVSEQSDDRDASS